MGDIEKPIKPDGVSRGRFVEFFLLRRAARMAPVQEKGDRCWRLLYRNDYA